MPTADWDNAPKDENAVPEGEYLCEVVSAEEKRTTGGDEMLNMKFKILDGKQTGRFLFDNMVFSRSAMRRVKIISAALGLPTQGKVEINEELLRGRQVFLTTKHEEYGGETRSKVEFAGYRQVPPDQQAVASSGGPSDGGGDGGGGGDDIPF